MKISVILLLLTLSACSSTATPDPIEEAGSTPAGPPANSAVSAEPVVEASGVPTEPPVNSSGSGIDLVEYTDYGIRITYEPAVIEPIPALTDCKIENGEYVATVAVRNDTDLTFRASTTVNITEPATQFNESVDAEPVSVEPGEEEYTVARVAAPSNAAEVHCFMSESFVESID